MAILRSTCKEGLGATGTERRPATLADRVLWWVSHLPGGFIIAFAALCLNSRQAPRFRMTSVLRGDDAILYSWVIMSVGLWALFRYGAAFRRGRVLRYCGYAMALAALTVGVLHEYRRMINGES